MQVKSDLFSKFRRTAVLVCLFVGFTTGLKGIEKEKEYLIVNPYPSGLFSIFNMVAGLLDSYEKGELAGFRLEFQKGYYLDPLHGDNWWEYYCEPLEVGSPENAIVREIDQIAFYALMAEFDLTRKRVNELIKKYIRIKPELLKKALKFSNQYFKSHTVIGLHYRGTDKAREAPRVPYSKVVQEIKKYIASNKLVDFRIFVATDEQNFLEYIQHIFPSKICALPMFRASGKKPLHISSKAPYQQGANALVDALLLARVDYLFRTSSNLSLWSTYFNPELPVIMLNNRY